MEKDVKKIDIDLAEFHGLGRATSDSPYMPPATSENLFEYDEPVQLGLWSCLSSVLASMFYAFMCYIFASILMGTDKPSEFLNFVMC